MEVSPTPTAPFASAATQSGREPCATRRGAFTGEHPATEASGLVASASSAGQATSATSASCPATSARGLCGMYGQPTLQPPLPIATRYVWFMMVHPLLARRVLRCSVMCWCCQGGASAALLRGPLSEIYAAGTLVCTCRPVDTSIRTAYPMACTGCYLSPVQRSCGQRAAMANAWNRRTADMQ